MSRPVLVSQCVSPDQLQTERLENDLRPCGENWLNSLKFSFLMMMTKVFSSSQRSMLAHKSSASKIAETELENRFSNLLRLVADKPLPLLHLICLFLVFRLKCCNGFSLKLTGLMCDGRSLASPLFRRLAGRGAFFCCFLFRWILRLAAFLIRGSTSHGSSFYSRENCLGDCDCPCDPLSCLLFSALCLRCSQSILVQETPSATDVDFTCSTTLLFRDTTCPPVGPMSLDWPVHPFGRSDSSGPLLPPDVPSGQQQRGVSPASGRSRGRQGALHAQPQILQRTTKWMNVAPSFPKACDVLLGTPGALLDLFFPDKRTESSNSIISKSFWATTTSLHGKNELLQAIQVLAPRFRLFGTFLTDNENAGGPAICIHMDLLPDDDIVTHVVTCQGRDHLVKIRSGRHSLVIEHVHFEPELTLWQLRVRLSLIHPHWPAYPRGVGFFFWRFELV